MKRVNFGHKGGFPLEQETLIHLQRAYADDMLGAMLGQWGIDPTRSYLVKEATSPTDDGWIIHRLERKEVNAASGEEFSVIKPELLRLKYNGGRQSRIEIFNSRSSTGNLEYADGQDKRVYEEWMGRYLPTNTSPDEGNITITNLIRLKSTIALTTDIAENEAQINAIKEDYLPRDGSKAMTGDLRLGVNRISKLDTNEAFTASLRCADFTMGYSSRRGQTDTDRPLGRALVDGGESLNLNYAQDWEKTNIYGDITLPNIKTSSSTRAVVIESDGNIGASTGDIITPQATESVQGKARIATQNEVDTGVDNNSFVTPKTLKNNPLPEASIFSKGIARIAKEDEIERGDVFLDNKLIITPSALKKSKYMRSLGRGNIFFEQGLGNNEGLTVFGAFNNISREENRRNDSRYSVTFSNRLSTSNYTLVASIVGSKSILQNDFNFDTVNDAIVTFSNQSNSGFDLLIREVSNHGNNQRILIKILIIA